MSYGQITLQTQLWNVIKMFPKEHSQLTAHLIGLAKMDPGTVNENFSKPKCCLHKYSSGKG